MNHPGTTQHQHDDPRSSDQACTDATAVRRQAEVLRGSPEELAFLELITKAIQDRRATRDDREDVTQFEVLPEGSRGGTPVVAGELLVRSSIGEAHLAAVERLVGAKAGPVDDVPGLLRLRNREVPVGQLVEISRVVRGWGHQASVAHLTPLRPVAKGQGGPEPTEVNRAYRPAKSRMRARSRVRVAVVDTGVPKARRKDGWLAGTADAEGARAIDPLDAFPLDPGPDGFLDFAAGHGAFVAGIVQQVAPDAAVSMFRAIDSDGVGSEVAVAQAIVRAVRDHGAQVVNLSLGAQTVDDQPLLAIEVALEHVERLAPGVVVIAAAGNYGDTRACFPAAQRRVVAVAALTAGLKVAPWTSRGFWVTCSTVGEGIVSTYVAGKESTVLDPEPDTWEEPNPWAVWCGSSFAAPQIAGAVARRMADDGVGAHEALATLLAGGEPLPDAGRAVRILPGTAG